MLQPVNTMEMSVVSSQPQSADGLEQADRSWEHTNSSLVFQIPHWGWRGGNSCLVLVGCLGACPRIRRLFPLSRLDDTDTFTLARTLTPRFQIFVFFYFEDFAEEQVKKLLRMVRKCLRHNCRLKSYFCRTTRVCSEVAGFLRGQLEAAEGEKKLLRLWRRPSNGTAGSRSE